MKRIEVTIESHKLSEVCEALRAIGIQDVVTSPIRGNGCRKAQNEAGGHVHVDLSQTRLEIIVSAERAAEVIRAFASLRWRDLLGNDGKMFVYEVVDPVRSRTSEPGENAG